MDSSTPPPIILTGGSVASIVTSSSIVTSTPTEGIDNLIYARLTTQPPENIFVNDSNAMTYNYSNFTNVDVVIPSSDTSTYNNYADIVVVSLAVFFIAVSLLGNTISLLYFTKKGKLTLPSFLYIVISSIDICISIVIVPVIASLLNSRDGTWFENDILCLSWPPIFYFLIRMSMCVVMMISLTRAIVIKFPFLKLRIQHVSIAVILYAAVLVIVEVVYLSIDGLFKTKYRKKVSSCEVYFSSDSSVESASTFYSIILQIELILPCIIVFISFIVCLISLLGQSTEFKRGGKNKFRKVSITITLFAGVFLVCSIPAFLLQLDYLTLYLKDAEEIKDISRGKFIEWYGHLLSYFFLALFNAAVNPCLYLLRMPEFQNWLKLVAKDPKALFRDIRPQKGSMTSSLLMTASTNSRHSSNRGNVRVQSSTRVDYTAV